MKQLALILFLFMGCTLAEAAVVDEVVDYNHGDDVLEGYIAYDDRYQGKRPGIIVVHEWKGLGDYAKSRARQLAELGYVAFAVDMYGKGLRAEDHTEAAELSGVYREDRNLMRSRAKVGLDNLLGHHLVNPQKIAAIGYCFGGTTVLEMARAGFDVDGVVSFHGGLSTPIPAESGVVQAKVLVMNGAEDKWVSAEEIQNFKNEMIQSGADWQLVEFGDTVHSFTVPGAGNDKSTNIAYNEQSDKRSWQMMQDFFEEIFAN